MSTLAAYADPTREVLAPVLDHPATGTPAWVTNRGSDVRGYDRREAREVYGPGHVFATPSDITVTNGLIRFTVGARGLIPYLNVSAFQTGVWREVGCLLLAELGSATTLAGARLVAVTPERASVALSVASQGTVTVRLQRGESMLRITHGTTGDPEADRYVGWLGTPPAVMPLAGTIEAAAFSNGLRVTAGQVVRIAWPPDVPNTLWSLALRWVPDAASTAQADSGLATLLDADGDEVASLQWFAANDTIRWTAGANVLSSAPLTFAADDVVTVVMSLSATARTLSTKTPTGAMTHATDALIAPGAASYSAIAIGSAAVTVSTLGFGEGGFGQGAFGGGSITGGVFTNGAVDNVMLFADALTTAEAATLAAADNALEGLPDVEADMVLYVPFDTALVPLGSALVSGMTYEATTQGGATAAPDTNGLLKGLTSLRIATLDGLALRRTASSFAVGAFVVESTGEATAAASQHAAAIEQTVRVGT